jgi:lipoprotein-anchoring transpeptidase ErfK/SrfK
MAMNRLKMVVLVLAVGAPLAGGAVLYSQTEPVDTAATSVTTGTEALKGPLSLRADISERRLRVYAGDEVVRSYPVAVGKSSNPTPRGRFTVRRMIWNPGWTPPPNAAWAKDKTAKKPGEKGNPMKVVKIFFREPDYYIHGTNEVESLGKAASHGCLRMAPDDVAELARYLMEHGGRPQPESWFSRIRNMRFREQAVNLRTPIPLVITS